jgi:hypothetical protein
MISRYRVEIHDPDGAVVTAALADGDGVSWDIRHRDGRYVAVDSYVEVIERLVGMAHELQLDEQPLAVAGRASTRDAGHYLHGGQDRHAAVFAAALADTPGRPALPLATGPSTPGRSGQLLRAAQGLAVRKILVP